MGILIRKTIEKYEYNPNLHKWKRKPVVCRCDFCKKVFTKSTMNDLSCNLRLCISKKVTCPDLKCQKKKVENTNMKKYGVRNPFQSDLIKMQIVKTNKAKYGAAHHNQTLLGKEARKSTNLKRYGFEVPMNSPTIRKGIEKRFKKLYGQVNPGSIKKFQEKQRKTMLNKYGVEHNFNNGVIRDQAIKNYEKVHGVKHPLQNKTIALKVKNTKILKGQWFKELTSTEIKIAKEYSDYRNKVLFWTYYYATPNMLSKRCNTFHIDHIYSVYDGFHNKVQDRILCHRCNIRMLSRSKNSIKHKKSHISLVKLKEKIRKYEGLTRLCKINFYNRGKICLN